VPYADTHVQVEYLEAETPDNDKGPALRGSKSRYHFVYHINLHEYAPRSALQLLRQALALVSELDTTRAFHLSAW
jgi:hypothetical protein